MFYPPYEKEIQSSYLLPLTSYLLPLTSYLLPLSYEVCSTGGTPATQLRATSYLLPEVFAGGDCALNNAKDLPQTAQVCYPEGKTIADAYHTI